MSSSNQSILNSSRRSSLFSNRNLNESMASRQSKEDSLISNSRYKSPFYEGKVSFGGSSAKRVRLSKVLPYNLANKPTSVTRIKDGDIKRLNEVNDHLSNATKNMLQNIYKASSPLEDAKKIPVFDTSNQHSNEKYMINLEKPFKRISSLRTPKFAASTLHKTSSPIDREKLQLKWEELENRSAASKSLNNSFKQSNLIDSNNMTDSSISYLNQPFHQVDYAGGKMKNRITRLDRNKDDLIYQSTSELPNISLPINSNSLPTFNFNKKSSQTSAFVNSKKRPLVSISREDDDLEEEFKFSAPKAIKLERISESFLENSIRKNLGEPKSNFLTANQINKSPAASKSNQSNNKSSSSSLIVSSNLPANLETNKTIEMYKLDKLDTDFNPKENKATLANTQILPIKSSNDNQKSLNQSSFNFDGLSEFNKNAFLPNKTWECDTCSVRNELTANKCVACEQPRLKEIKEKNVNNIYSNYSFGSINTEKKGFNAFKFDSTNKLATPSIQSQTNLTTPVALNLPTPSLNSPATNSSNELATPDKTSLTSTEFSTTITSSPIKLQTSEQKTLSSPIKPFNFITTEVADKASNNKLNTISSVSSLTTDSTTLNTTSKQDSAPLTTNTWGKQFQKPKDTWECSSCLVNNKLTDKKCVCCEQANPNEPKEDNNKITAPALTFPNTSTGGFKFNLTPSTTASTKSTNDFSSLINSTSKSTADNKSSEGFSFKNLTSTSNKSEQSAPKFTFGISNQAAATDKPVSFGETFFQKNEISSWKCKNCSTINDSKNSNCLKCDQLKGDSTVTENSLVNLNKSTDLSTSNLFSKPISETTANSNLFSSTNGPSFTFGQPLSSNNKPAAANKTETSKPDFVFGAPSNNSSKSLNGELKFNLSSSANLNPQSNSFFPSANSTSVQNTSLNSSFNQFGNKAQFGLPAATANASTSIFSSQSLTNGFVSSKDTTGGLFSSASLQTNQPNLPPVNNFSAVFSPTPSFNFGSAAAATADQSANQSQNSVFQFSGQPNSQLGQPLMNNSVNLQGRQIRKAKRRLGKE